MRILSITATAAAIALSPLAASAEDNALALVAALTKIEANVAEGAAALYLAATPGLPEAARADAVEEYAEDAEQIAAYVAQLQGMALGEAEAKVVADVAAAWEPMRTEGESLLATPEDSDAYRERLVAYWGSKEALDDVIDAQLTTTLTAAGVTVAP
jgi:hypothetical protein